MSSFLKVAQRGNVGVRVAALARAARGSAAPTLSPVSLPSRRVTRQLCRAYCTNVQEAEFVEKKTAAPKKPTGEAVTKASAEATVEKGKAEDHSVEPVRPTEKIVGDAEKHTYQAETKKLLDIVARSLYTDKEVFLRELISNASDALEKLRLRALESSVSDPEVLPAIRIHTDEKANKIVIEDTGIGMSKAEIVENLGTIAKSGTEQFLKNIKPEQSTELIGRFGVGFYSVFVVGKHVKVYSKSASEDSGHLFVSDGSGSYEIYNVENLQRGTRIEVDLKEDCTMFSKKNFVESIIKKFSNFVNYDIYVDSSKVNIIKPLWMMSKNEVTPAMHKEFYQFIAHAYDDPMYTVHYQTDSPFDLKCLFYVPDNHTEGFGMQRMESGVALYCRKVLVQKTAKNLLPDFLRFIKGVVDCADIPLNVSREFLQDSSVVSRVSSIITRRILKNLVDQSQANPDKYIKFYERFGNFIKEGICTDVKYKDELAKLLRFATSTGNGDISLDEYIERASEEQKAKREIYFLQAPSRRLAESSPYFESFKDSGLEVIFVYNQVDEIVMTHMTEYEGWKMVNIQTSSAAPPNKKSDSSKPKLDSEEFDSFAKWFKDVLATRVSAVKESTRLKNSPAVITDHESATMRRMMSMMDPAAAGRPMPKQVVEINPEHPLIVRTNIMRRHNSVVAGQVAEQIFDNALIAAGLLEDPRDMLPRLQRLLENAVSSEAVLEEEAQKVAKK